MKNILFVALSLFMVSCVTKYESAEKSGEKLVVMSDVKEGITVSLKNATFYDAIEVLPNSINIAYDRGCVQKYFNLDVENIDLIEYVYLLGKIGEIDIERHGNVFVFTSNENKEIGKKGGLLGGSVSENNKSGITMSNDYTLWVDLAGWSEKDFINVNGFQGLQNVSGDLWVYRGSIQNVVDFSESLDYLRKNIHKDYYFEVFFINSDLSFDFGSNEVLGLDVNWRRLWASGMSEKSWEIVSNVAFSSFASYSKSKSVKIISGVVRENVTYEVKVGDSIPFVSRTVSDAGTVTDTGVKYENIGLNLNLTITGSKFARVDFSLDNNDVAGYQQGYAVKHGSNMKTVYSCNSNDKRYVGSYWVDSSSKGLLNVSKKHQMWDVFIRIERLSDGQFMRKN